MRGPSQSGVDDYSISGFGYELFWIRRTRYLAYPKPANGMPDHLTLIALIMSIRNIKCIDDISAIIAVEAAGDNSSQDGNGGGMPPCQDEG